MLSYLHIIVHRAGALVNAFPDKNVDSAHEGKIQTGKQRSADDALLGGIGLRIVLLEGNIGICQRRAGGQSALRIRAGLAAGFLRPRRRYGLRLIFQKMIPP